MRDDIAKVIVERPRAGGGTLDSVYRREVDWTTLVQEGREEDSPSRESIRKKWGFDHKEFRDFLAPIRGFLRKSVGRPWNDVWSEISSHLSLGSTTQRHVLGHVFDYVEIHTIEQPDGSVTDSRGRPIFAFRRRDSYYVCPRTGILCEVPRPVSRRYRWRPKVPVVRFHRIHGIWYEIGFARPPATGKGWLVGGQIFSDRARLEEWLKSTYDFYRGLVREVDRYGNFFDVLVGETAKLGHAFGRDNAHWRDDGRLYCFSKRQVGKRELRQFGLRQIREDFGGPPAVVKDVVS